MRFCAQQDNYISCIYIPIHCICIIYMDIFAINKHPINCALYINCIINTQFINRMSYSKFVSKPKNIQLWNIYTCQTASMHKTNQMLNYLYSYDKIILLIPRRSSQLFTVYASIMCYIQNHLLLDPFSLILYKKGRYLLMTPLQNTCFD